MRAEESGGNHDDEERQDDPITDLGVQKKGLRCSANQCIGGMGRGGWDDVFPAGHCDKFALWN